MSASDKSVLNPYINFYGNAREAMEFYHKAFGGDLTLNTYKQHHHGDPSLADKIMHASLTAPNGMILMASDSMHKKPDVGNNITISLSGTNDAELRGYWSSLSEGGKIGMPLEDAPWGDCFGSFTDKYGIEWMVNIVKPTKKPKHEDSEKPATEDVEKK